ncbi:DUF6268 family outer membrane beta-barrel protein [Mucilaginibacter polytrichastri]|uniref:DUF6268 domain-containing protein n=1 Tax=Mucilaginibacter polytrichastri TaxID=1302689 RepID=A0A1Q5ZSL2_9SPHI|nr:DUF6268 family outer membrane beta-barrel protein [Mucilaginibacter polytrichastri]OKS84759.1 hypothetical protein RG47T_0192 [Mucilaginibacter polytrichastri]SFT00645.1 hypothetical protein SAMN04487890_10847 [Mucilaginibacter polytrichastri]
MKNRLFLVCMLLPVLGYCQGVDSSGLHKKLATTAPFLGGVAVNNIVSPVSANGNTFTMQQPIVDLGFPVYKDFSAAHSFLIKTGIRYQGLFLSGEQNISSNEFNSITVPLLINYSLSQTTSISFVGLATLGSDIKGRIGAADILYTAGVRLGFRPGKSFRYGITLAYSSNYSGKFLLPIPDIDWTINKKWSFTGVIPARASLKYKLSELHSLGITASFSGSMYRLDGGTKEQYIHLQQSSAGLIYDLKLNRRWKLNLIAGHTLSQRLETFNMDQRVPFDGFGKLNDRIANISYRQNSFIFQAGLSYEF